MPSLATRGREKPAPGARCTTLTTLISSRSDFYNLEGTMVQLANAPILQMRKLRPSKVKRLAQGHSFW